MPRALNSGVDFKDDVESSLLLLLKHLDVDLAAHGATWFKQNILDLTAESARELIRGRSGQRAQVDYDRLYAYRVFAGLDAKGGPEEHAHEPRYNLDGAGVEPGIEN